MVLRVPLSVVPEQPLSRVLHIPAVPGAAGAGKPPEGCPKPSPLTPTVLQRCTVSPCHGQDRILSRQASAVGFSRHPLLPQAEVPAGPGVCRGPDSWLFRAAGNSWNREFLQGSALNLHMFVAANSHSLLWLRAHIFIALCIPSGPVSREETPVFLEQ